MTDGRAELRPLVLRHWLAEYLGAARTTAGMNQAAAAAALGWSVSKLNRVETAAVGIQMTDAKALLDLYGVTDPDTVERVLAMARRARRRDPFAPYRKHFSEAYDLLTAYEASASEIWSVDTVVLPGLLQTHGYAHALLSVRHSDEPFDALLRARMVRQRLLDDGPKSTFVLDEALLHRRIGGPQVFLAQLERLHELASRPDLDVLVLPFTASAHLGLWEPFMVIEIPGSPLAEEPNEVVVYRESGDSEHLLRGPDQQIKTYRDGYTAAAAQSLGAVESLALIAELRDRLAVELAR
ncbi:transcriptional regulator with XRE-family HTH domain [Actinokineospora baliensis]|uniref:helix-turn-helix domain-containing protein n=1 Tax=Actinokineospora baliensis TaxID=547056 RepID=UPI0019564C9B|nr:helix-turn-helix transcriptional regulator [Actinokineospora baliensis]MBM7774971.1 transcriptional regulator with XRE-family HTH domain [Actinokineospora baliensis]